MQAVTTRPRMSARRAAQWAHVSRRLPAELRVAGALTAGDLDPIDVLLIRVVAAVPSRWQRSPSDTASPGVGVVEARSIAAELREADRNGVLGPEAMLVVTPEAASVLPLEVALLRASRLESGAVLLPVGRWLEQLCARPREGEDVPLTA